MRFFALLDLQHMVLALFLGLGLVVLLYAAWMGYREREPEGPSGRPEEERERAGGTAEDVHHDNPVSPMLMLLYVVVLVWMVAYVIVVGIRGGPIW